MELNMKKLGLGMMRLPKLEGGADADIDKKQTADMIDLFLERGFKYIDTAFMYHDGESEKAVGELLVSRHPRESFFLASKLPLWEMEKEEDLERIFKTQLERTRAGYFDRYLIHGIDKRLVKKVDEFDAWGYVKSLKEKGLARSIGFSFHSTAEHLDEILTNHPEMEFVQLQLNYADWESEDVQSRLCYEVAERHNKPVTVMEPVRGGALAAMPDSIRDIFLRSAPDKNIASWALRFVAGLPLVDMVLSGMSNMQQLIENMDTFDSLEPLTQAEHGVISEVMEELSKIPTIPCTACKYCVPNCPQNINIPRTIELLNDYNIYKNLDANVRRYNMMTKGSRGRASSCIECGKCEGYCPQNIKIMSVLVEAAKAFEG